MTTLTSILAPATTSSTPTMASALLGYYESKDGVTSTQSSSAPSTKPVAPWNAAPATNSSASSTAAATTKSNAAAGTLAQTILGGASLINPGAAKLSVSSNNTNANSDYKNLFALYQGLTSLQTLASAAGSSSISTSELAQLQKAFGSGLTQVQSFLTSGPFREFQVADGTVTNSDQSTAGAPGETDTYTTGLKAGSVNAAVPALEGDVQFSMTLTKLHQTPVQVSFNLADMGSTPRSLSNVVSYLNSKLAAAGVATRFDNQFLPSPTPAPAPVPLGATSPSTPATPATPPVAPQFALAIKGSALEAVSLSAPATDPAVYVAQTSTAPGAASSSTAPSSPTPAGAAGTTATVAAPPAPTSQVIKLDPTGAHAVSAGDKVWTDNLPSGATVQATQTASDGSVYVLADVTATTNGQAIQGAQDVALLKYDTAGNLAFTRTLGAASSASGYALAVSADASQVAVAGTVTGTLDPTDTANAASSTNQSFVQVYDSGGNELWTQNQSASADNQVNAVAFGANNSVYVAGTTQGRLPGASSAGGQDAYVQGFSASQAFNVEADQTLWTAKSAFVQQFGTSGVDRATGIAVNGSSVYVSSVENGDAVVRQYDVTAPTAPVLAAKQDLGALNGGDLSGIGIGANGAVVVAGSTHDGALSAGTVTSAYTSGGSAFVAQLSSNLDPTAGEHIAYYSSGHATTATGLTMVNGEAYITGQMATGASASGGSVSELGYAAQIDPTNGAANWSQTFKGSQGNAAPASIAVSATGSSALDALGLPQGALSYTQANTVVANTSLRPGDEFYVKVGGGLPAAVTVAASDTYATLATKIQRASGFQLSATTTTDASGAQEIKIAPTGKTVSTQVSIEAGPDGRNALAGLGLKAGLVTNTSSFAGSTVSGVTSAVRGAYTINVPTTLALTTPAAVKAASTQISNAISELQGIYYDMTRAKAAAPGSTSSTNSSLIAFYNTQAAADRNALARLGG